MLSGAVGAGFTGSFIFSQTIWSGRAGVTSRLNGAGELGRPTRVLLLHAALACVPGLSPRPQQAPLTNASLHALPPNPAVIALLEFGEWFGLGALLAYAIRHCTCTCRGQPVNRPPPSSLAPAGMFALPGSGLVQYLPCFFFGSLLLLFGLEIMLDWMLRSYHKLSAAGELRCDSPLAAVLLVVARGLQHACCCPGS